MKNFSFIDRIIRLKQIAYFSKILIQQFGLVYFIKAAFDELKKERLHVLSPEFIPKVELASKQFTETDYEQWLQRKIILQTKEVSLSHDFSVNFYMQIPSNFSSKLLKNTIHSLKSQDYDNWKLYLFSQNNESLSNYTDDKKIFCLSELNDFEKLNSHVSNNNCDLIGFLKVGEKLQFNALTQFLYFVENKDCNLIYSDSDQINNNGKRINPFFKPDWLPYMILSENYIGFYLIKRSIFLQMGGLTKDIQKNGNFDFLLRCNKETKIFHIPFPLVSLHSNPIEFYYQDSNIEIVKQILINRGISTTVQHGIIKNTIKINFPINTKPKVSIIIPTKDSITLLERCLDSIENKTNYDNLEIIIVDNASEKFETKEYLKTLNYQILHFPENYNFSKINNFAVRHASGELILFMNDDVAAIDKNWLNELVSLCLLPDVAIVGPKLLFSNNTIQSAGSFFLKTGAGWHPYSKKPSNYKGNFGLANIIRDYSAVTASCMLMKKNIFHQIGGYDINFDLYYGDSDLCFRSKELGYSILYTPFVALLHDGAVTTTRSAKSFFAVENHYRFVKKHPWIKNGDPTFTPNLDWNHIFTGNEY